MNRGKRMRAFLSAVAALSVFVLITGCSSSTVNFTVDKTDGAASSSTVSTAVKWDQSEDHDGYQKVAETQALKLFYNEEQDAVEIHNKASGTIWSSLTDWEPYGLKVVNDEGTVTTPNPLQNSYTGSMIGLVFTDVKANEGKLNWAYSKLEPNTRQVSKIDNGVSIAYDFSKLKIQITVEITLDDSGLKVRIPNDKIVEEERNLLMSVELLPGFGASTHQDEGYILYPDGCGGLLRYENYNNRPNTMNTIAWGVYGVYSSHVYDYFPAVGISANLYTPAKYEATMPVFGVKKGDDAYVAYISQGAAQTKINISPEGYKVPFNRACFEVQYRDTFDIILSNISAGNSSDTKKGVKVDKERWAQDYELHYNFLNGDEANYSGMAQSYRAYLLETEQLNQVAQAKTPLMLDLFCGVTEYQMLFDKFISMTTFDQAQEIMQELIDLGVDSQKVTLKGWAKGGYGQYSNLWPAASDLGGKSGLKDLFNFSKDKGLSLFVQSNPIYAFKEDGGFNIRTDTVYAGNNLPFTDDESESYLIDPTTASTRLLSLQQKLGGLSDLENVGMSLDGVAKYVYANYRTDARKTRSQTAAVWSQLLDDLKSNGSPISVQYGNQYALSYADMLYEVPIENSKTNVGDETVPFVQMVLHGSIPYTANAGNLFYDDELQKLQWIEYGCAPYFELTYQRASELKYTNYNQLYTSYYGDWIDTAAAIYKEFNENLAGTWDSAMIEHTRLSSTLVRIRYESGKTVYINYNDAPAEADGQTIPARDYLVV